MCFSRRSIRLGHPYEEFENSRPSCAIRQRWKAIWMKLKKEKRRLLDSAGSFHPVPSYDEHSYLQNFDQGSGKDEPENFSRSFSVRFADPAREFPKRGEV
ncbi:hypothetical protein M5689_023248 [Euphorbia peplus]|nr:hypothetical protein M5689_023248 [Euphorbia peplus]